MLVRGISYALNTNYQDSRMALEVSMRRLSTGDKHSVVGEEMAADLSMSERFRAKIHSAEASVTSVQTGLNFLNQASQGTETVIEIIQRMTEIAAGASDPLITAEDRETYDQEFQFLKEEIAQMSRESQFFGKQTIGRDTIVSYDANTERVRFFQSTGADPHQIERDFGSGDTDRYQNEIGFDSSEDYTMSRDGKSLFFMGTVTGDGAGVRRLKRYDIESHTVHTSTELYDTGDKLFVNEDGSLYVNGSGTVYSVDKSALTRTATGVADAEADTEFTVYKDAIKYYRTSDNRFVSYDTNTTTTTNLTGVITFGSGVDHTVSGSGRYIAEEAVAGSIRVYDTQTNTESTFAVGGATAVEDLKFNEDGDRIYYIDKTTNSIHFINVTTDTNNAVTLTTGSKIIQGTNSNSFNGLDLGGSNYGSTVQLALVQDSLSILEYEAADLSLYALGLVDNDVNTTADAETALTDLKEALNRANAERSKLGATASRFEHVLNTQRGYIADLTDHESQIRDIDMAKESSIMSAIQLRHQTASAILAQFNSFSRNVLSLLNI